jgi:hypothetical protein
MMNKSWLAAYLYYNEPWENILIRAVKPFADEMREKKLSDRFFFIRYWEKGPHIRLRFHGDEKILNDKVRPALDKAFTHYYEQHPSKRIEPQLVSTLPEEHQWLPDNSIQYIEYEPETERYGGEDAIVIAEEQFEYSSDAVLSIIEENEHWDYDSAMGAAIHMHLAFAYALGMDLDEAKEFYAHTFKTWLPRAYSGYYSKDEPKEEQERKQQLTLKAFETTFEKQKPSLVPFHAELWNALQDNNDFEEQWLNDWISGMRKIKTKLEALQNTGKLEVPHKEHYRSLPVNILPDNKERWSIYDSYVHMTNNRLGIRNQDEGYLGYIIMRSLEAL